MTHMQNVTNLSFSSVLTPTVLMELSERENLCENFREFLYLIRLKYIWLDSRTDSTFRFRTKLYRVMPKRRSCSASVPEWPIKLPDFKLPQSIHTVPIRSIVFLSRNSRFTF